MSRYRIMIALLDRETEIELARRARARAVERFSLRSWIQKHEQLFEQLLGNQ